MTQESQQERADLLRLFQTFLEQWQSPSLWMEIDLTLPQIRLLISIAEHEPVTVKQLADLLMISHVTTIRLLEHLDRAELIERQEDTLDRRRKHIRLTARGQQYFERVSFRKRALAAWLATLGNDDLETVRSCLSTLIALAGSA